MAGLDKVFRSCVSWFCGDCCGADMRDGNLLHPDPKPRSSSIERRRGLEALQVETGGGAGARFKNRERFP